MSDEVERGFEAADVSFTDEGLVFVCLSEAEAQRAYCEAIAKGHKAQLDRKSIILLKFGKQKLDDQLH
jgi:hypothetical protein